MTHMSIMVITLNHCFKAGKMINHTMGLKGESKNFIVNVGVKPGG